MKTKLTILSVVCLVVALIAVVCLSACKKEEPHQHQYTEAITTPATCTEDGVKTLTCSCGDTKTETIPATGHNYVETVITPVSCTEDGESSFTCSRCNDTYTETKPHGHTLVFKRTVAPTCTEDGYDEFLCTTCYESVRDNYVEKGEHDWQLIRSMLPTCTEDGYDFYRCSICYGNEKRNIVEKLGHDFDFSVVDEDDYFSMAHCTRCDKGLRRESLDTLRKEMVYSFDPIEDKNRINAQWAELSQVLKDTDAYNEELHGFVKDSDLYNENKSFEHDYYDVFCNNLQEVTEQYQYAYIDYCVKQDSNSSSIYTAMDSLRSDMITRYYSLFRSIYETKYREYFFSEEDGWTEEDIQTALDYSDTYGGGELAELDKQATAIETEFDKLDSNTIYDDTGKAVSELMGRYVKIQNRIAELHGYANYMEYAYSEVYERDYTTEQTNAIHEYIKTYFGRSHYNALSKAATWYEGSARQDSYISAISGSESIFDSLLAADSVKSYFEQMTYNKGSKPINYFQTASDLFKNGNYFRGKYEGAFTWWVSGKDSPILYFGPDSYSDSFTFVHEFGHYYNDVYNQGAGMSMDLNETHSQANEMLFAHYLKQYLADKANKYTAEAILTKRLQDAIRTILLATAVDEFENIVYSGTYTGNNDAIKAIVQDGVDDTEYDKLGEEIFDSYGMKDANYYWRAVTIHSPGYYISYATSMISSLEFWAKAETDGLDAAKDSYFKLFTFTDEEDNAYTDHDGDLITLIGYADVLEYCGVTSPFAEETYQTIGACIDALTSAAHDPE